MSSLRKKFPNCFVRVRVEAKLMPTGICGYSKKHMLFLDNAAGIPIVSARQAVKRLERDGM